MATTGRIRRAVIGLAAGLTVVLSLLGTRVQDAGAQPIRVKEQQGFVRACKEMGGTPTTGGPRIVRCTFPDGIVTTCNFKTNDCDTTSAARQTNGGEQPTGGKPVGGVVVAPTAGDTGVEVDQGQDGSEEGATSPLDE